MTDYVVKKIPSSMTDEWLLKKHYAKRKCSISYSFGLYRDNLLEGIVTFGSPPSRALCVGVCGIDFVDKVIELNRLCINSKNSKNSASFLVSQALKQIGNKIVVSYADTSMQHIGYIYQATNWIYTGLSAKRTERYDINNPNAHSKSVTERKGINYQDLAVRERPQKHRYIYFVGNKRFKKQALKNLKYQILPYPKGETKKYECIDIKWNNGGLF